MLLSYGQFNKFFRDKFNFIFAVRTDILESDLIFFFFFNKFIYLFLAALGLCCCTRAFSSCSEQGLLFVTVHRLLIAVASLVAEHGL